MTAETKLKIQELETVKLVLDKFNVRFFIIYGALLGFHRDGDFLPDDDDIDIAIVDPISLETRKKIGWALYDLGFQPQPIMFNVFGRMEPSTMGYNGDHETGVIVCDRGFKFTIFFYKEENCTLHGKEYVCTPMLGALRLISTPIHFFDNPVTIKIGGQKYLAPSPIDKYLSWAYFDNWKDKTDRRHSDTYLVQHQGHQASIDLTNNNETVIYGK